MGSSPAIVGLESFCGSNLGSIQTLEVIRYKKVLSLPPALPSSHYLTGVIALEADANFESFTFPPDVVKFSEPDKETQNGIVYLPRIEGTLNRTSPSSALGIRKLQNGYYIIKFTDFNGFQRILGSPEEPVMFRSKGEIGTSRPDANEYTFEFSGTSRWPAFFLDADLVVSSCALVSLSDFIINWAVSTADPPLLQGLTILPHPSGLVASINYPFISGSLYAPNGSLVTSLIYNIGNQRFEPSTSVNMSTPGTYTARFNSFSFELKTGVSCNQPLLATYTTGTPPSGGDFDSDFDSDFD
ncbi:MAG: hypothetical protein KDC69_11135 [Flavobacteriaceae bacterium]|nr:hypothetical protein [Flavobacteriaceae bacterium]